MCRMPQRFSTGFQFKGRRRRGGPLLCVSVVHRVYLPMEKPKPKLAEMYSFWQVSLTRMNLCCRHLLLFSLWSNYRNQSVHQSVAGEDGTVRWSVKRKGRQGLLKLVSYSEIEHKTGESHSISWINGWTSFQLVSSCRWSIFDVR